MTNCDPLCRKRLHASSCGDGALPRPGRAQFGCYLCENSVVPPGLESSLGRASGAGLPSVLFHWIARNRVLTRTLDRCSLFPPSRLDLDIDVDQRNRSWCHAGNA